MQPSMARKYPLHESGAEQRRVSKTRRAPPSEDPRRADVGPDETRFSRGRLAMHERPHPARRRSRKASREHFLIPADQRAVARRGPDDPDTMDIMGLPLPIATARSRAAASFRSNDRAPAPTSPNVCQAS